MATSTASSVYSRSVPFGKRLRARNLTKCSFARMKIPNLSHQGQSLGQVDRVLKDCGFVCHRFFFGRG
jgi:hypothetical protein